MNVDWDNHISELKSIKGEAERINREEAFRLMGSDRVIMYLVAKRRGTKRSKDYVEKIREQYNF